jgi:hypothetical protein
MNAGATFVTRDEIERLWVGARQMKIVSEQSFPIEE